MSGVRQTASWVSRLAGTIVSPSPALNLSLVVALLLAGGALTWSLLQPRQSFDDAYITYRYARNLAAGQGFVYNPGQRVLGTTAPLYALVLAGVSLAWHDIPAASLVLGGLGWAGIVVMLYGIGRQAGAPWAGLVAGALAAADPLISGTLGMETTLTVALCLLAFSLQIGRRPRAAAVAAGIAFVMRWDGILVIGVVLLAEWARERRLPWQAGFSWLAVAGPWLLFSQLYFGSIFPNTFFAKAGQAQSGLTGGGADPFGVTLLHLAQARLAANSLMAIWLPLGVLGVFNGRAWLRTVWPLVLWTGLYVAGYLALGVIGFHWYYAPIVPTLALLVGGGIECLARLAAARAPRGLAAAGAVILATACLWPQAQYLWLNRPAASPHVASYQQVSDWLVSNTPPASSVGLLEIGVIGYETRRPIVDMMGLVTPAMVGHLYGWDQAFHYAVADNWPDYVVALQGMAWANPSLPDPMASVYAVVHTIDNPADSTAPILIFKRRPGFPPAAFTAQWPQHLLYDQLFTLDSMEAGAAALAPGQALAMRLKWSANADVHSDYRFEIDLLNVGDGRRLVLRPEAQPMYGGAPTGQWRRGNHYTEDMLLRLPDDLAPGAYRLVVRASLPGRAVEPAAVGSGQTTPAMSGVLLSGPPAGATVFVPAPLQFGQGLTLLGQRVSPAANSPSLVVTLYWSAAQPLAGAETVFVHVLDGKGQVVGQDDSQPAGGALPVTLWGPGVTVTDAHPLTLTAPAAPGSIVCVGVYDPLTLTRLDVQPGSGYDVHDNEACRPLVTP